MPFYIQPPPLNFQGAFMPNNLQQQQQQNQQQQQQNQQQQQPNYISQPPRQQNIGGHDTSSKQEI